MFGYEFYMQILTTFQSAVEAFQAEKQSTKDMENPVLWTPGVNSDAEPCARLGFPGSVVVKNPLPVQEMQVWSLGQEDPLEKEMDTHSTVLAQEIAWTEELAGCSLWGFATATRLSTPALTCTIT